MEERLENILSRYDGKNFELIPILQEVQNEFGYLPEPEMGEVANFVGLPKSRIYGVATFFEQFRFTPMGKNRVTICRGTACHVRGAQRITEEIERRLGIKAGETTEDLEYTIETAACIGCCGLAPTIVVNEKTYGHLTPAKTIKILNKNEEATK
ncbi:MAG: NADH-quinone oxidoreductase subunit NuoE [Deltaproteobacteria bacterium]|jgi:NADH:ubiquinone oxidoreductase subunit E|nr:NADH-quinone oxidoreductase subunit NuoE [Deltaproteobacteria bacterium]